MKKLLFLAAFWVFFACSEESNNTKNKDLYDSSQKQNEITNEISETKDIGETSPKEIIDHDILYYDYEETGDSEEKLPEIEEITEPVPLRCGVAKRYMPVPVGIPTSGYGPAAGDSGPYCDKYPATKKVWMPLNFKAMVIEGGMGRIIFLKCDLVGINSHARQDVLKRLMEKTGINFQDSLIIGGTHTHSGPGRLAQGLSWEMVQDTFFPEFYDKMINTMVDTILDAFSDLEEVKIGVYYGNLPDLHHNRRCEEEPIEDGTMPVLVAKRKKDDKIKGILFAYAIHGTVLSNKDFTLSGDAPGGLELKIEEQFDYPVVAMFFNSWAGDMAPSDPFDKSKVNEPASIPDKYSRIEALGNIAAKYIVSHLSDIEFKDYYDIYGKTYFVPLNREVLGYSDQEFPYEYGAVYCGIAIKAKCYDEEGYAPIPDLDKKCLKFPESSPAPDRTIISAISFGNHLFITFPGEPVTAIAKNMKEKIHEFSPDTKIFFLGYAQDYTGYSVPEDNWYYGGYEAAGSIWGPKQGDYLANIGVEIAHSVLDKSYEITFTPMLPVKLYEYSYDPLIPPYSKKCGEVAVDTKKEYSHGETVVFSFYGGDSWLNIPYVVLLKEENGEFNEVLRKNGTPLDIYGYEMSISLSLDPPYYKNKNAKSRNFIWKVEMPTKRNVDTTDPELKGTFKLKVEGYCINKDGEKVHYSILSGKFTVK